MKQKPKTTEEIIKNFEELAKRKGYQKIEKTDFEKNVKKIIKPLTPKDDEK